MERSGGVHVSHPGQMSVPASAWHRWGLDAGGEVGCIDLGDAVVIVPGRVDALRRHLLDAVTDDDWNHARTGFGDDELSSE